MDFHQFFKKATDYEAFDYQIQLAEQNLLPDMVHIPTGLGKTSVILIWIFRKFFHPDPQVRKSTPTRLVYCLPMRTLVRQTEETAQTWINRLYDLKLIQTSIPVTVLMGGEIENLKGRSWDSNPAHPQIILGTQDQLLSRALNRGYSMSRYRWPAHFALLNNDSLWIMDEVQLMGSGLVTSLQLDGFRKKLGTSGDTHTLWMSATLNADMLDTVDHPIDSSINSTKINPSLIDQNTTAGKRLNAPKPLSKCDIHLNKDTKKQYPQNLAGFLLGQAVSHQGRTTLVILNQVKRAVELHKKLTNLIKKQNETEHSPEVILLHSHFRPMDRRLTENMLQTDPCDNGRIIISTQVVEAGVDLDSAVLITELAPWSSLVQRFGRCNRRGYFNKDECHVYWIDIDSALTNDILPYSDIELDQSRQIISSIDNAGIIDIHGIDLPAPQTIPMVIRKRELLELFDTSPDLAGWDIDIGRYIRESRNLDLHVFWRSWEQNKDNPHDKSPPDSLSKPLQNELCPVSLSEWSKFHQKVKKNKSTEPFAWIWDPLDRQWRQFQSEDLRPGIQILVSSKTGGYSTETGWTGDTKNQVPLVENDTKQPNEGLGDDKLSNLKDWETIRQHTFQVHYALEMLLTGLEKIERTLSEKDIQACRLAVIWHDRGKAHPAFQNMLTRDIKPDITNEFLAKSPKQTSRAEYRMDPDDKHSNRRYFRHELISALAILANGGTNLSAYLAAAHHGRIRTAIRSTPDEVGPKSNDRFAMGVWEGDCIPETRLTDAITAPELTINLELMELGEGVQGPSWIDRIQGLLREYGPFKLAWLEYLIRVADWRGSAGNGELS